MPARILVLTLPLIFFFAASQAAASSCSAFVRIDSFDAGAGTVEVARGESTTESKFFPRTDGAPFISKLPSSCKGNVKKQGSYPVVATGGRMKVTQIRTNRDGKMLNDTEDPAWLPAKLEELIADRTTVAVIFRPPMGKKKPFGLTTVYLPVTQEELDEIKRLEAQAEDVD